MNDCIVKQYGCSCAPGECAAQPKPLQAPVICFKWRHHLAFIVASGIASGFIALGLEQHLKSHAPYQQEAYAHVNRN